MVHLFRKLASEDADRISRGSAQATLGFQWNYVNYIMKKVHAVLQGYILFGFREPRKRNRSSSPRRYNTTTSRVAGDTCILSVGTLVEACVE